MQANHVAREAPSRVVVLAGRHESGKTTIITSLFESFLDAPFGGFLFAGSRTLVGFERRCHHARPVSGRDSAHTPHTQVDATEFLHLKLSPSGDVAGAANNLLLSDISGERFRALRDSSEAVKEMALLKRADHLCMVLDCERLANPALRQSVRFDARMLLRSIIEAQVLARECKIDVVFAKWDLVLAHADRADVEAFAADTEATMRTTIGQAFECRVFRIAARPTTETVPFAFGLPTLLQYWLETPLLEERPRLYLPKVTELTREPARFVASVTRVDVEASFDVRWI
ncbi:MAG: hypothetical protein ABL961_14540 [Vicinamibacterales bacterium]